MTVIGMILSQILNQDVPYFLCLKVAKLVVTLLLMHMWVCVCVHTFSFPSLSLTLSLNKKGMRNKIKAWWVFSSFIFFSLLQNIVCIICCCIYCSAEVQCCKIITFYPSIPQTEKNLILPHPTTILNYLITLQVLFNPELKYLTGPGIERLQDQKYES